MPDILVKYITESIIMLSQLDVNKDKYFNVILLNLFEKKNHHSEIEKYPNEAVASLIAVMNSAFCQQCDSCLRVHSLFVWNDASTN